MPQSLTSPLWTSSRLLLLAGVAGGVALAGTLALWAYYGSTVFFELIAAGLAACF